MGADYPHCAELGVTKVYIRRDFTVGIAHIFLQHTSAGLTLNENCDSDVRADMWDALDKLAPRAGAPGGDYRHTAEGPDDMPGHIKSSLVGASLTIPITQGRLALGTWQGVGLVEAWDAPSTRAIVVTVQGATAAPPAAGGGESRG